MSAMRNMHALGPQENESWTYETETGYVRRVPCGWARYTWYAGKSTPDGGYAPEIGAFATRSEALAAISA